MTKLHDRTYSKLEIFSLNFLFQELVEAIKASPDTDPKVLITNIPKYHRGMLRQSFGISRIMFKTVDNITSIVVGLDDRRGNYTIEARLGPKGLGE